MTPVETLTRRTSVVTRRLRRGYRDEPDTLYLELLRRCLTGFVHEDPGQVPLGERPITFDPERRRQGLDWPSNAETMIGMERLVNLQNCVSEVIRRRIPGDLIETGVWRGGAAIFMRGVLAAFGEKSRTVWLADSFQGLPKPDPETYPADADDDLWAHGELGVSLDQVKANFARYGLLDDQVRFLPGWFRDTLPSAPVERLAVLRLDGDLYESTIVALRALYPKVSPGGYLIVDDYALEPCRAAVDDYRSESQIREKIRAVDWTGIFWRKATD